MTEIEQQYSEHEPDADAGCLVIGITIAVLFVPTIVMWYFAVSHCWTCVSVSGNMLASYLPCIALFSAIGIGLFVVYVLKVRSSLWATLLTIAMTSSILIMVYSASTGLQEMGR
jgi:hypothetical protein